ncbi:aldolase [Sphaerisporangium melleum]|uniref:Aldolase n=1 Tax=Sphaerisporangium melleum TaxID=321316 RepID=A0A917R1V4_9ACTN|nr:aldolase [Sphaerisporangium melleum]GGK83588.1 aldolase [Sphaerisporangium melleum]GII69290.1 aldolase [Sphaerisporangium melleum]
MGLRHLTLGETVVPGFDAAHAAQTERYPGSAGAWQPVHTVYVPADRFGHLTVREWGDEALALLERHLPDEAAVASVFGPMPAAQAADVRRRVARKLVREPIEDLRIDFEDGYGTRTGREEDRHADSAARSIALMDHLGTLPRRWGPRVKSFADGDPARSIRTLDMFLTGVVQRRGRLPDGFTVTFPKVLMEEYLGQFASVLSSLEEGLGLVSGTLRFEMQVEAPQTVMFLTRSANLVPLLGGRLAAAHFGVFDYTAACGLPPAEQRLDHPVCDHAREVMRVALAGTGVELSDGSLAASPASDATADVHRLWRAHAAMVRHSLRHGFYQGWDMHPSHLAARYATVYAFHLATRDAYAERVRAWEERRAAAGGVMDEPATVKTLSAALHRAALALDGTEALSADDR